MKTYKLGELFCGCGGIAYGALKARSDKGSRLEHAWATDYDSDSCRTYRKNIKGAGFNTIVCADIREMDLQRLMAISEIDALAFGFPCNDFSNIGEQKGLGGQYGPLYTYGVKALEMFRPIFFVAENVSGLASANSGKAMRVILEAIEGAGYNLYTHLYKFEEYGVPQTRHRYIITGIRSDIACTYEMPGTGPYKGIDITCRNAIENPPIPKNCPNSERSRVSANVAERLKYINPGQNVFTADLPDHLKLNVKNAKISQLYKRLNPNKPAYTILANGGGGTAMYHWKENRPLTNRERARLQTFPDDFVFTGNSASVRKQIGMAVPPKASQIIFTSILNALDNAVV